MLGRPVTLLRVAGFSIRMDASWLPLALLVAWSLAEGLFPYLAPGLGAGRYWLMALAGLLGLALSLVLHELSHAVVARRFGIPVQHITLFLFGGVAELRAEPDSARGEFLMAGAGPLASAVLATLFWWGYAALGERELPLGTVLHYLALLNLVLALFNLLPAYPMDGGRMLRAALWAWHGDVVRATRLAAGAGRGFGLLMLAAGAWLALTSSLLGGLWWALIGLFLYRAARLGDRQQRLRSRLVGRPVRGYMTAHPLVLSPDLPLRTLADEYLPRYHHRTYPVVAGERLLGCIDSRRLGRLGARDRDHGTVADLTIACREEDTVAAGGDAFEALGRMSRSGAPRLLVLEQDRLVGVLTRGDLLRALAGRKAGSGGL